MDDEMMTADDGLGPVVMDGDVDEYQYARRNVSCVPSAVDALVLASYLC